MAEDDEWEQVEAKMAALKIEANKAAAPKPAPQFQQPSGFAQPPRFLTRPQPHGTGEQDVGGAGFYPPQSQDGMMQMQGLASAHSAHASHASDDEPLDSAVLEALRNPRERMNVLNAENSILNFVRSGESIMEIPPISNSFRRLIIYRVAQRFRLTHGTSGDGGILLYRTSESHVPQQLLIDMKITNNSAQSQESSQQQGSSIAQAGPDMSSMTSGDGKPKKLLVMRREGGTNKSEKKEERRQQPSVDEREKAYAEARARIFGGSGSESDLASKGDQCGPIPYRQVSKGSNASGSVAGSGNGSVYSGMHEAASNQSFATLSSSESPNNIIDSPAKTYSATGSESVRDSLLRNEGNGTHARGPPALAKFARPTDRPSDRQKNVSAVSEGTGSSHKSDGDRTATSHSASVDPTAPVAYDGTESGCVSISERNSETFPTPNHGNAQGQAQGQGQGQRTHKNNKKGGRKTPPDAANWKEVKYTARDKEAERCDPDFARRNHNNNNAASGYYNRKEGGGGKPSGMYGGGGGGGGGGGAAGAAKYGNARDNRDGREPPQMYLSDTMYSQNGMPAPSSYPQMSVGGPYMNQINQLSVAPTLQLPQQSMQHGMQPGMSMWPPVYTQVQTPFYPMHGHTNMGTNLSNMQPTMQTYPPQPSIMPMQYYGPGGGKGGQGGMEQGGLPPSPHLRTPTEDQMYGQDRSMNARRQVTPKDK